MWGTLNKQSAFVADGTASERTGRVHILAEAAGQGQGSIIKTSLTCFRCFARAEGLQQLTALQWPNV